VARCLSNGFDEDVVTPLKLQPQLRQNTKLSVHEKDNCGNIASQLNLAFSSSEDPKT
jgi:hypothetical protein